MSSEYERKLIIVGRSGNGKSSLGNVLLGKRVFKADDDFCAVTQKCQIERNVGELSVVDTPGLFDCNKEKNLAMKALEIHKVMDICPNPHAFLIVLNGSSRLTEEELSTISVLRIIFGVQCLEKAIIVLTHVKNTVGDTELREKLQKSCEMSDLVNQCGGRYARIDNTKPNPEHIDRINTLVDQVSRSGKDSFYNKFLYVNVKALEEAVKSHDSGPFHEQIERLLEQIQTYVREEKEFEEKCWKVAGYVGLGAVNAGVAYFKGGSTAVVTSLVTSVAALPMITKSEKEKHL